MLSVLSWRGRMSGRDYFATQLAIIVAGFILDSLQPSPSPEQSVNWVALAVVVALGYLWWVSTIRRLHDTGRSGWHALWFCLLGAVIVNAGRFLGLFLIVPFVWFAAVSWLTLQPSIAISNRWGPPPLVTDDALQRIARSRWNYVVLVLPGVISVGIRYLSAE